MNPEAAASLDPVGRKEHSDHLVALPATPADSPDLWTELHNEVQEKLALLESEIRRKLVGIRVDSGRTQGGQFFLCSYRTFSMPDETIDPVVAGLTFTPEHERVTVEADVSGEQTGDWISAAASETVANSREELLAAAGELARTLCQSADAIAAALKDPVRRVE